MKSKDDNVRGRATLSGQRKCLRSFWLLSLCLSLAGGAVLYLFLDKTSWVDDKGILHEPLWGLVPISIFFIFLAAVLALLDLIRTLYYRKHEG